MVDRELFESSMAVEVLEPWEIHDGMVVQEAEEQ
jgi:hypothetical protein